MIILVVQIQAVVALFIWHLFARSLAEERAQQGEDSQNFE